MPDSSAAMIEDSSKVFPVVRRRSDRLKLDTTKHELDNVQVKDIKRKRVDAEELNAMASKDTSEGPKFLSSSGFTQEVEATIIDRIRKSREKLNDEDIQSIDTFISLGSSKTTSVVTPAKEKNPGLKGNKMKSFRSISNDGIFLSSPDPIGRCGVEETLPVDDINSIIAKQNIISHRIPISSPLFVPSRRNDMLRQNIGSVRNLRNKNDDDYDHNNNNDNININLNDNNDFRRIHEGFNLENGDEGHDMNNDDYVRKREQLGTVILGRC
mmetsp:Transcript_30067/g.28732  ORF Transcript_30067/g.28732 Transcript_30067/m.28732 type:complete len:269 (-) Transcript_30067:169-975(-)